MSWVLAWWRRDSPVAIQCLSSAPSTHQSFGLRRAPDAHHTSTISIFHFETATFLHISVCVCAGDDYTWLGTRTATIVRKISAKLLRRMAESMQCTVTDSFGMVILFPLLSNCKQVDSQKSWVLRTCLHQGFAKQVCPQRGIFEYYILHRPTWCHVTLHSPPFAKLIYGRGSWQTHM